MTKKFILPGSFEVDGRTVTAGIVEGNHSFDVTGGKLRYIEANTSDMKPDDTVESLLFRVHDNSTGCLIKGDFKHV